MRSGRRQTHRNRGVSEQRAGNADFAGDRLQAVNRRTCHAHDDAALRFAEQRGVQSPAERRLAPEAVLAEQRALGERDRQAPVGAVVSTQEEPFFVGSQHGALEPVFRRQVYGRKSGHAVMHRLEVFAARQRGRILFDAGAEEIDRGVTRREPAGNARRHVLEEAIMPMTGVG